MADVKHNNFTSTHKPADCLTVIAKLERQLADARAAIPAQESPKTKECTCYVEDWRDVGALPRPGTKCLVCGGIAAQENKS